MNRKTLVILTAATLLGGMILSCAKDDDEPPDLGDIRLFYTDDVNGWIHEINPKTEKEDNFFPAPSPWVSPTGGGLAFNSPASILYFYDPSDPDHIHRIIPDASGPGLVSALTLPEPVLFPYDGLGFDGNRLLALDASADWIDALNPGTGAIEQGAPYAVDLEAGLDVQKRKGIYAAGVDPGSGEFVIFKLGMEGSDGKVLAAFTFEPGFDPRGIAMAKGYVFIADAATSKIKVFLIRKKKKTLELKPVKEIDYDPPGASISALAAGWR